MKKNSTIDYSLIFIPLIAIVLISSSLFLYPDIAKNVIDYLWNIMVNKLGFFYMLLGFSLVIIALYLAFYKYGKIN